MLTFKGRLKEGSEQGGSLESRRRVERKDKHKVSNAGLNSHYLRDLWKVNIAGVE